MSFRYIRATLAVICTGALTLPALAQDNTSSSAAPPDEELQQITVTGSRIIVNGNDAPTPVTVVTPEQMAATKPTTIFEQLSELPQFDGSGGNKGIPSRGVFGGNNTGAASLNLRGLGSIRALVLLDGHRVPYSTPDGQVDINLMPQLLLQRVDVVTGGASAVYGSDAVSGVMNFILDRKFNGVKLDVQGGESGRHDDGTYQLGIAGGTDLFSGRGHVEASFQQNGDQGLRNYLTRPSLYDWVLAGDGSAQYPYRNVQGTTRSDMTWGGYIIPPNPFAFGYEPNVLGGQTFDQNGILSPLVTGPTDVYDPVAQGSFMTGGGGAIGNTTALVARTKLDQAFVRLDFDITDNLHAWANATAANDYSYAGSQPNLEFFYNISKCNPYLSTLYQGQMGCSDPTDPVQQADTFQFNKLTNNLTSNLQSTITSIYTRNYNVMAGLEGKFGNGYHWDATYTFSETKEDVRNDGIDEDQHLFAAIDAVKDSSGNIVCEASILNPSVYSGCVPIDLFGPNAETPAALAYSYGRVERWSINRLNGIAADVTGSPLNDWAGPVGFALSGEFRDQTLDLTSNTPMTPIDCTGIDNFGGNSNCVPGATYVWGNLIQPMTAPAEQKTAEGALETNVPLIADMPFAKSLAFNGAGRYTRYSNNGIGPDGVTPVASTFNANTWKLGLTWAINDQLTLRWTRSRDIRAPNLWELFNPYSSTASNPGATDYLLPNDYLASQSGQITQGDPHLRPEVGQTTTIGLVWKPLDGLSVAIDAYKIHLKDAITVITGSDPDVQKACYAGATYYCQFQTRDPNDQQIPNRITQWYNRDVNLGYLETSGIDFESNYNTHLQEHSLSLRGLVTYKPHEIYAAAGLPVIDQAGAAYCACSGQVLLPAPVWRAEVFAGYDILDSLTVNASERWRSSMRFQGRRDLIEVGDVPAYYTTNLTLTYTLPVSLAKTSVYLNVQNVFDKLAPPVGTTGIQGGQPGDFGGFALGDDVVGRYFTLGVRARL